MTRHIQANPLQHEFNLLVAHRPQISEVQLAAMCGHTRIELYAAIMNKCIYRWCCVMSRWQCDARTQQTPHEQ